MNYLLTTVQIIHSLHDLINIFYIYYFPKKTKYDIYMLGYILFLKVLRHFLKGECLISYIEKIIINKNYKLGHDITYHPYLKYYNSYNNFVYYTKSLCMAFIMSRNL
jgi:hypothetical protein